MSNNENASGKDAEVARLEPDDITECQFHNNCGGWCETQRELEMNLCESCLESEEFIEQEDARKDAEIARLREENEHLLAKTAVSCGVGDGSGQLIVHGDYDSIKRVQAMVFELEKLRAQLEAAQKQEPVAFCDESDEGLFVDLIYGENGNPLKLGDKLYAEPVPARVVMPEPISGNEMGEYGAAMRRGYEAFRRQLLRLNPGLNTKGDV